MKDFVAERLCELARAIHSDPRPTLRPPVALLSIICSALESRGDRQEFADLQALYEQTRAFRDVDRAHALAVVQRALDTRNRELPPHSRADLVEWPSER